MTPSEFKTWFRGFAEACGSAPTPEQWQRLKEVVEQAFGEPGELEESEQVPLFTFPEPDAGIDEATVHWSKDQPLQGDIHGDGLYVNTD